MDNYQSRETRQGRKIIKLIRVTIITTTREYDPVILIGANCIEMATRKIILVIIMIIVSPDLGVRRTINKIEVFPGKSSFYPRFDGIGGYRTFRQYTDD